MSAGNFARSRGAGVFAQGVATLGATAADAGADDNDDVMASISAEENLAWQFEVAVENGFDQIYYERLADELTRSSLPLSSDGVTTDAWALTEMVQRGAAAVRCHQHHRAVGITPAAVRRQSARVAAHPAPAIE